MLAMSSYPTPYIEGCRAQMQAQLAAYRALVAAAPGPALAEFEPLFFNNLVLVLETCFMHRTRAVEKKDGNPLNEVRMLAASLLEHGGVLTADSTIKYNPDKAVLKLPIGAPIRLTAAGFTALAEAYFAALTAKFGQAG